MVPAHRKALTRLFVSSHILAIEVLRWGERYRPKTPREWRLCRFCKIAVEDEAHALLRCTIASGPVELCHLFIADAHTLSQSLGAAWDLLEFDDRLACLLQLPRLEPRLAQYVHQGLEIFRATAIYVAPESLWRSAS
ncbi:uncharacterized protein EV420DRAFT_1309648 [Desarmillaria tabescens]|uniref:Uncharacterized protein n=1 Tax=Armillaria tabescens TaxID=1929756 RepID=A0AA39KEN2_ARMTA|nr:uncharacterized protein EV420DRAFT_1309648 [Desarmillaria tabescens]KAK0457408.1 hypothetical protein EV420DRAFT_1309648 [Desarmillaria tabescens]